MRSSELAPKPQLRPKTELPKRTLNPKPLNRLLHHMNSPEGGGGLKERRFEEICPGPHNKMSTCAVVVKPQPYFGTGFFDASSFSAMKDSVL